MRNLFIIAMVVILHSVCVADEIIPDDVRRDINDEEISKFNPDKYPSLGFSVGTDRFDAPYKYRSNTMIIDGRFPITPWTTFWAEAGILKFKEGDQSSSNGRHYRGGVRWYFHK